MCYLSCNFNIINDSTEWNGGMFVQKSLMEYGENSGGGSKVKDINVGEEGNRIMGGKG